MVHIISLDSSNSCLNYSQCDRLIVFGGQIGIRAGQIIKFSKFAHSTPSWPSAIA
ncbi:MAG: hypothetical protein F6K55_01760 [Moorea sp. SIO4A3]|nr:hypothetical protein [Moorena sp. SIO4A3]